ncbi:MAG: SAM-dependent methyltransferase [Lachnospiraceae bacterium]|nr:SAM-dependent methyltransferase [Lachnospiraceae bacterium]
MKELKELLDLMLNEELEQIVLSDAISKESGSKVKIRPILIKDQLLFQATRYSGAQVFHANLDKTEMTDRICTYLSGWFRQAQFQSTQYSAIVLVSKKGRLSIKKRKSATIEKKADSLSHNRTKHYLLEEGTPVSFLIDLGVQTPEGKIVKAKYDKFRQINRYLEFTEDILDQLPTGRPIRIVDFGCGKSYLTFALYYYLHEIQKRMVTITGLDLKKDLIEEGNALAKRYGYEHLHFQTGEISTFDTNEEIDMVVSLHACDTATDAALEKAIRWNAKVIFAVPCCQHELSAQITNPFFKPMLQYGIIKERFSALLTDSIRACLLESEGYRVQILEFIDMEHTPKNLLIRAVLRHGMRNDRKEQTTFEQCEDLIQFFHISPTLKRLLESSSTTAQKDPGARVSSDQEESLL